jgi:hypothetical protein
VDGLRADVQDLKHRMTSLERPLADIRVDMVAMTARIDRVETRLERRLDLIPVSP